MAQLNEQFKAEFRSALQPKGSCNEVFQKCMEVMREHKVLYTIQGMKCMYFLTHKFNRGGLMLSPHNAHRNGAVVHKGGADKKQLVNAVCIELAPSGKQRDEQIAANKKLIARSSDMLAPVNGEERYITVGCGHMTAFCKVAAVGGKTPQKDIADDEGRIDVNKLKKNKQYKEMIDDGWDWTAVPHSVDLLFPEFAKVAQRALNVSNHVSQTTGELETCVLLADIAQDMCGESNWKSAAVESVRAMGIPCAEYASVILEFVCTYGGGADAPQVRFMNDVATQFQCNVMLGETFWTALTQTKFHSKTSKFPFLRVAIGLANLTSPKKEDGIAKLLTKSDIAKLSGKQGVAMSEDCERMLKDAWDIVSAATSVDNAMKHLGQFFVRVALFATEKGKLGREKKDHTVHEIRNGFLDALSKLLNRKVTFEGWTVETSSATSSSGGAAMKPIAASLSDHSKPEWVAEQAGFTVGKNVVEKHVESNPSKIFAIFSIDTTVVLQQVSSYTHSPLRVSIKLEDLLSSWSITSTEPPLLQHSGQQRPRSMTMDMQKAKLFTAVSDIEPKAISGTLDFWRRPDEVRCTTKINVGALVLVPFLPLQNITTKNTTGSALSLGSHEVSSESIEFFAVPPPKPVIEKKGGISSDAILNAFWWVGTTAIKSEANMEMSSITKYGIDIPIMKNKVVLEPFTVLKKYKAKDCASNLQNATILSGDDSTNSRKRKR